MQQREHINIKHAAFGRVFYYLVENRKNRNFLQFYLEKDSGLSLPKIIY